MVSKTLYVVVASILSAQAVYSQCLGGLGNVGINNVGLGNNLGLSNNIGLGYNGLSNNIGLGYNGFGNNAALGYNGLNNNAAFANNGLGNNGNIISNAGTFSVSSSSPAYDYPGGVVVTSENQIGGQVAVAGNVPFLGSAYFGGEVPSTGEGNLAYNAGPSVSLNGGGCGYGQGGSYGSGVGTVGGFGGASAISGGFGGASVINGAGFGRVGGCNCGY